MENLVVQQLLKQGFTSVGILNRQDASFGNWIDDWLALGYHGSMSWMEKNRSIRQNPCSIEPYGRSVISAVLPYYSKPPREWGNKPNISCYAWGADYHQVVRKKLQAVISYLETRREGFTGRAFVDSAPLPEKLIAARCGLGWIGKNSLLITPGAGSFVFLGEIVCNLDLESTPPIESKCDGCDLCVNACPNQAILENGSIDSRRCVSYLTIEKKGPFSHEEENMVGPRFFGCDICQKACPWNANLPDTEETSFRCFDRWRNIVFENMVDIDPAEFDSLKRSSPIKRIKLEGFRRNAAALKKNLERQNQEKPKLR